MNGHRSRRRVLLLAVVAAVLALQFMYVANLASGAPKRVAQKSHAADSRELVSAGNELKAPQKVGPARGAKLALTGGAVAPTVSIAFLIMLDGALMILFARPKERLL